MNSTSPDRSHRAELTAFRAVVCAVASISLAGPLAGLFGIGALAALFGLPAPALDPALSNHLRAVATMFACAGAMLIWSVVRLDEGRAVFRIGVAWVLVAGTARAIGWWQDGDPGWPAAFLMAIELLGFPALLAWHTRLVGLRAPAPGPAVR